MRVMAGLTPKNYRKKDMRKGTGTEVPAWELMHRSLCPRLSLPGHTTEWPESLQAEAVVAPRTSRGRQSVSGGKHFPPLAGAAGQTTTDTSSSRTAATSGDWRGPTPQDLAGRDVGYWNYHTQTIKFNIFGKTKRGESLIDKRLPRLTHQSLKKEETRTLEL